MTGWSLILVLLEPVRSAEPPIRAGSAGIRWSSAASDQTRVAFLAVAAAAVFFAAAIASAMAGAAARAGCSIASRVPGVEAQPAPVQASRAALPRAPQARQAASTLAGTSKGAWLHPSLSRAPAISSAPSGEPWVEAFPDLVGAP